MRGFVLLLLTKRVIYACPNFHPGSVFWSAAEEKKKSREKKNVGEKADGRMRGDGARGGAEHVTWNGVYVHGSWRDENLSRTVSEKLKKKKKIKEKRAVHRSPPSSSWMPFSAEKTTVMNEKYDPEIERKTSFYLTNQFAFLFLFFPFFFLLNTFNFQCRLRLQRHTAAADLTYWLRCQQQLHHTEKHNIAVF